MMVCLKPDDNEWSRILWWGISVDHPIQLYPGVQEEAVVGCHWGQNVVPSISVLAWYSDVAKVNLKAPTEILQFEVQYFTNQWHDNIIILPLI